MKLAQKTFFFCSEVNFPDDSVISPRVPIRRKFGENNTTKRICVSTSIDGCLSGIEDLLIDGIYNVFTCSSSNYYKPTVEQVIDVNNSDEYWILSDVKLTKVCSIKILRRKFLEVPDNPSDFYMAFDWECLNE